MLIHKRRELVISAESFSGWIRKFDWSCSELKKIQPDGQDQTFLMIEDELYMDVLALEEVNFDDFGILLTPVWKNCVSMLVTDGRGLS